MLYSCGHGISSLPYISILAFVPSFSSIFQRGWNHQLELVVFAPYGCWTKNRGWCVVLPPPPNHPSNKKGLEPLFSPSILGGFPPIFGNTLIVLAGELSKPLAIAAIGFVTRIRFIIYLLWIIIAHRNVMNVPSEPTSISWNGIVVFFPTWRPCDPHVRNTWVDSASRKL